MKRSVPKQIPEYDYLENETYPIIKNNYIVISGCAGGGKSTLLKELANRGFAVVWESGRQIIREQTAIEGDALPWIDFEKYLDLALSRYLYQFNAHREQKELIFFDRGIIDAIQIALDQPPYFRKAVENFRYNNLVFLAPPWEEIFTKDAERQQQFEESVEEFDELLAKYKVFEYETLVFPKISVKERADLILDTLAQRLTHFI